MLIHQPAGQPLAQPFVVEARDFSVFGEALKRKLLLELISSLDQETAEGGPRIVHVAAAGD